MIGLGMGTVEAEHTSRGRRCWPEPLTPAANGLGELVACRNAKTLLARHGRPLSSTGGASTSNGCSASSMRKLTVRSALIDVSSRESEQGSRARGWCWRWCLLKLRGQPARRSMQPSTVRLPRSSPTIRS